MIFGSHFMLSCSKCIRGNRKNFCCHYIEQTDNFLFQIIRKRGAKSADDPAKNVIYFVPKNQLKVVPELNPICRSNSCVYKMACTGKCCTEETKKLKHKHFFVDWIEGASCLRFEDGSNNHQWILASQLPNALLTPTINYYHRSSLHLEYKGEGETPYITTKRRSKPNKVTKPTTDEAINISISNNAESILTEQIQNTWCASVNNVPQTTSQEQREQTEQTITSTNQYCDINSNFQSIEDILADVDAFLANLQVKNTTQCSQQPSLTTSSSSSCPSFWNTPNGGDLYQQRSMETSSVETFGKQEQEYIPLEKESLLGCDAIVEPIEAPERARIDSSDGHVNPDNYEIIEGEILDPEMAQVLESTRTDNKDDHVYQNNSEIIDGVIDEPTETLETLESAEMDNNDGTLVSGNFEIINGEILDPEMARLLHPEYFMHHYLSDNL